jgi:protein-tyrosine phosphatase
MGFIDIHSHILHGVDDGSKSLQMSLELLEMMKGQGITDVIATPHFDARYENFEEYTAKVNAAYEELLAATVGKDLPNIYLGSEVYYFKGIGKSYGIRNLALAGSRYILVELAFAPIDDTVIKEIQGIYDNVGLKPIIAHVERYADLKGFKKLLKLLENGTALAQVNAPSVYMPRFKRVTHKLIKRGLVSFLATDTHSTDLRPPLLDTALLELEKQFGSKQKEIFDCNSDAILKQISNIQKEKVSI